MNQSFQSFLPWFSIYWSVSWKSKSRNLGKWKAPFRFFSSTFERRNHFMFSVQVLRDLRWSWWFYSRLSTLTYYRRLQVRFLQCANDLHLSILLLHNQLNSFDHFIVVFCLLVCFMDEAWHSASTTKKIDGIDEILIVSVTKRLITYKKL